MWQEERQLPIRVSSRVPLFEQFLPHLDAKIVIVKICKKNITRLSHGNMASIRNWDYF